MARYIIVEVYPRDLTKKVAEEILKTFERSVGLGTFRGRLILVDHINNRLIFRVPTRYLKYVRYSILSIREIENKKVLVLAISVTGTVRKARAQARSIPPLVDQDLN